MCCLYNEVAYWRFQRLIKPAGIKEWPHDAMRHTDASHAFDVSNNSPLVCRRMGHVDDRMLFAHYRVTAPRAPA